MAQAHAIDAPIKSLLKKLDYSFNDISLLDEALTHRSYAAVNNERLEFLGDGILNFVIAHELFKQYPDVNEGDLSRLRANLVNKESLAKIAARCMVGTGLADQGMVPGRHDHQRQAGNQPVGDHLADHQQRHQAHHQLIQKAETNNMSHQGGGFGLRL